MGREARTIGVKQAILNDEFAFGALGEVHPLEGIEERRGVRPVEPSQSDVRDGLGHAISGES